MTVIKRLFLAFFALNLAATAVNAMGICFGGYPACCENGSNTCGPFCASCSRYVYEVAEYIQQKVFPTRFNQKLNFQKNRKDKKFLT